MVAAFGTLSVERAQADVHGAVGGMIALCIITGNCGTQQPRNQAAPRAPRPGISAEQRQQNREIQSALNTFGFPVGTVDGSIGPRSRSAISDYQAYMGYPATGQLTEFERNTLVSSWRRYEAGAGAAYPRTMAAVGPRGLLKASVDPNFPRQFGDGAPVEVARTTPLPVQPSNDGGQVIGNTAETQKPGPLGKLKPLQPVDKIVSVAARCELVELTTGVQGVIMASNMTDPNQALSEKFCDARNFSIEQGQYMASQFAVSDAELTETCAAVTTFQRGNFAMLGTAAPSSTFAQLDATANEMGLADPASRAAYGKICTGIGYRTDDAEMALAGALTILSAGEMPYAELIAHHLREGFGTATNPSAAADWYAIAIDALEQGAQPAFEPSSTRERVAVIRAAIEMGGLRAGLAPTGIGNIVPVSNVLRPLAPKK